MRQCIGLFEEKDIDGNVDIANQGLEAIPKKYGIITGTFWGQRNRLTSLKGAPREVGRHFYCQDNQLTTLEGSPRKINGDFYCYNNRLVSLNGAPEKVGGDFVCKNNRLITLKGVPEKIGGIFRCYNNLNLTPWEMRYILFTDLGSTFRSDNEEANNVIDEFMQLTPEEKQNQIQDYMERLREI